MSYGEAIWNDWYTIAEPINKLVPWCTFAISVLWYLLYPLRPNGIYNSGWLSTYLPGFIMAIFAGLFYFLILQERIEQKNLENATHIWLLIVFGLSLFSVGGIFIWVQFFMVGILSDRPFWRLFQEKYRYY
ncbi:MAG: hypothetical protein EU536_03930 [Promethearchaeota archaeon]|nr:MAG: hypothetical protein EU536_03930 [Candidatus Lokiarchaeota archaeon]